jgi:hypothetical protein
MLQGRLPTPGGHEAIGIDLAPRRPELVHGDTPSGDVRFAVVGVFQTGTALDAEVWTSLTALEAATKADGAISLVRLETADAESAQAAATRLRERVPPHSLLVSEPAHYAGLASLFRPFQVTFAALFAVIAVGACLATGALLLVDSKLAQFSGLYSFTASVFAFTVLLLAGIGLLAAAGPIVRLSRPANARTPPGGKTRVRLARRQNASLRERSMGRYAAPQLA